MVTKRDLNIHNYSTDPEVDTNLGILADRLSVLEEQFGKKFKINSGLRSEADQKAIIAAGLSKATRSNHLIGAAADISDVDGALEQWCRKHIEILEAVGIWCEVRQGPWLHLQIRPPKSGHRWFLP